MDMQKLIDTMGDSMRFARGDYHVTLGKMIEALSAMPPETNVQLDVGGTPGRPHSYRGYYSDLSFAPSPEPITAEKFLEVCKQALGNSYEGYKGGDFKMDERTPLWSAPYGTTGRAIMGIVMHEGTAILVTKEID